MAKNKIKEQRAENFFNETSHYVSLRCSLDAAKRNQGFPELKLTLISLCCIKATLAI